MIFNVDVALLSIDERVSKKGNAYITLKIGMPGNRYEYMNVMVEKDALVDTKPFSASNLEVGAVYSVQLDYNTKYKNFVVVALTKK